MSVSVVGFDWDEGNIAHCAEHGVTRDEIEFVVSNARFVIDDPSPAEKRIRAFGQTLNLRYVFVVFTFRYRAAGTLIRPISARYMHTKEVRKYEQAMARLEQ